MCVPIAWRLAFEHYIRGMHLLTDSWFNGRKTALDWKEVSAKVIQVVMRI